MSFRSRNTGSDVIATIKALIPSIPVLFLASAAAKSNLKPSIPMTSLHHRSESIIMRTT